MYKNLRRKEIVRQIKMDVQERKEKEREQYENEKKLQEEKFLARTTKRHEQNQRKKEKQKERKRDYKNRMKLEKNKEVEAAGEGLKGEVQNEEDEPDDASQTPSGQASEHKEVINQISEEAPTTEIVQDVSEQNKPNIDE